ncbi:polyphenol oxidase family protein [Propionimicrobium sp. BV2F7]|uniref:Purine nucleoside phosphorylase n=1 Tax=Propionimicrobium lymphophilum ACS-093-V-SCH5 TaxID=883161 RepID=S2VZG0_9ACTN|nr:MULTISPECIES: polyphenol oxidase family protein [Propionimicrobium]EPD32221.1 hypothetical protein HMPREF9306_01790 [Propionimicrobium lymphophilum ACS-093-V-SCH5]ETJ97224.1 YfiH family protein [Propionimicrobium sp. BV2F7]
MFCFELSPRRNGGVGVAFTDRNDGFSEGPLASFNLGKTDEDVPEALRSNMAALKARLGFDSVVALHQVHGVTVFDADADQRDWLGDEWLGDRFGAPLPQADASITTIPGRALMIRVADCVPVVFAADGCVAAAHAGRAGLLNGVLEETVKAIRERTSGQIKAWIGPHICGSCYELPEQMVQDATKDFPEAAATTSWGTPSLDLGAGAKAQLERLGVEVEAVGKCTRESADLFSHRGDGPQTGRQVGLVWLEALK